MVEVGGEVVAQGRNADGRSWRVGIEEPDAVQRTVYAAVTLDGSALATSGDYRNYRIADGRRISHIIDPRTGRPAGHSLASVSVVSATCMVADAWATALSVLGPEAGLALARQLDLSALFIFRREDGTLGEASTSSFETHRVTKENQP
jgi:thiamine biosynthesis lipoprotein